MPCFIDRTNAPMALFAGVGLQVVPHVLRAARGRVSMYSTPKHLATILRNAQGVADKETGRDIDVGRECLLIREEWDALHKELARVREENVTLRALLDEAPHEYACSFNICPMCDGRKNAPLHDDVYMKQEYHHAFQNGKCNCWKSRIPRAGG